MGLPGVQQSPDGRSQLQYGTTQGQSCQTEGKALQLAGILAVI